MACSAVKTNHYTILPGRSAHLFIFMPVESEKELREELAALEKVGDWSIDAQAQRASLHSAPCDLSPYPSAATLSRVIPAKATLSRVIPAKATLSRVIPAKATLSRVIPAKATLSRVTPPPANFPWMSAPKVTTVDRINVDVTVSSVSSAPLPVHSSISNSASIKKAEETVCDFPVIINKQVNFYLDQFQKKQRGTFKLWLERSAVYLPVIHKELEAADLPRSLGYLAMIESGFNPSAYSHAHAVGLWQFIRSTGKNHGLRIDSWVDERRNPEKATKAAISYLRALFKRFGDWQLAVAAYNAGEGKIERGLKKYKVKSFWELADHNYLSIETKRYVPKLIAAILVASNPEKYGFTNLNYKKPVQYDLLNIPSRSLLGTIAAGGSISVKEIRQLNNELLKNQVPPTKGGYTIKVPVGSQHRIVAHLQRAHAVNSKDMVKHKLRKGETLSKVSKRYNIPIARIMEWNDIADARKIQAGRLLTIYQDKDSNFDQEVSSAVIVDGATDGMPTLTVSYYKVRNGDSLWSIARKHQVSTQEIKRWNSLDNNLLYPGTKLVIKKS
ncbi:MAG: LysM peptidoglycan-binding domain-containing protein [Candidatus Electrothrix sp. AR4]|nr:LysM peptidoglycan-binding domain-containing protein [Candidatus Electrothrix sp. AR4]